MSTAHPAAPLCDGAQSHVFQGLRRRRREASDYEEKKATGWFEEAAAAFPDVKTTLVTVEGLVAPAIALRAKAADLTVLPSIAVTENEMFDMARDAALFQSGRPVLFVPNEAGGEIGETVVIAWKDAVEAVRAISSAAPFLETANHVRLISIAEDGEDETAAAMMGYLSAAGLPVTFESVPLGTRDVGDALLTEAGAGVLLVMGGYGRWRWREWVFGGATRHVLQNTDVAVLMSH